VSLSMGTWSASSTVSADMNNCYSCCFNSGFPVKNRIIVKSFFFPFSSEDEFYSCNMVSFKNFFSALLSMRKIMLIFFIHFIVLSVLIVFHYGIYLFYFSFFKGLFPFNLPHYLLHKTMKNWFFYLHCQFLVFVQSLSGNLNRHHNILFKIFFVNEFSFLYFREVLAY